jgi:uncharacterized protein YkwD
MRLASWFGGILVAVAVVTSIGAVALARHPAGTSHNLTAARQAAAPTYFSPHDAAPDPDHKILPASQSPVESAVPVHPIAAAPVAPPPPAPSRPSLPSLVVNSTQQALINQDRAAHGLGPLTWSSCLHNVAVSNAQRIAAQGYLSHTNGPTVDLSCGLGRQAGENIGYYSGGINDAKLNSMFMASPDHYANIMGPYHYVGTAWVVAPNGYGYIAVEFS